MITRLNKDGGLEVFQHRSDEWAEKYCPFAAARSGRFKCTDACALFEVNYDNSKYGEVALRCVQGGFGFSLCRPETNNQGDRS